MEIMYIWTQFLKEEAPKFLGIDGELDISKMYTYYLKYVELLSRRSKGLYRKGWRSKGGNTSARVSIEQKSGEENSCERVLSKENENCSEQPRHLESHGTEKSHIDGEKAGHSIEQPAEEGAMQNPYKNSKPMEAKTVVNNDKGDLQQKKPTCSKEKRHNRRYRSSTEQKGGKNKQNERLEMSLDQPTEDCDTNRLSEIACSLSSMEVKDTVNNRKRNGVVKCRSKQGTNRAREAKLNNCDSFSVVQSTVNEAKTDVGSELVSENSNNTVAREKGGARQRINVRRPRNNTLEQEKETRQPHVKSRYRADLDTRAIVDLSPETSIVKHLMDYSNRRTELQFERALHTCKICFEDKVGVYCMKFDPCQHVFCADCITNYFEVRIMEGTVLSIPCPEDKCPSEAQPSDVRALVSPEMYTKYDSILLAAVLDTQPDIMYCPRRQCQYPVFHEDKTDKLATCPECKYAFCVLCEKVYHGVAPCVIVPEEKRKLMQEYLKASDEHKKQMETRYGKQQLKNLVDTFHLEWCESWIKKNSKKCPHCNTSIEKSSGCNKMLCWKCETIFCWLCNMRLDKLKPYQHFNDPKSPCFNNLFQGVLLEDGFDEEFDFDEEFVEDEDAQFQ